MAQVSTTCIPFNMFLAASMSEGSDLAQTTRGVACAAVVTAIVSMLVVIIGSAIAFGEDMGFMKTLGCSVAIGGTFLYAIADDIPKMLGMGGKAKKN